MRIKPRIAEVEPVFFSFFFLFSFLGRLDLVSRVLTHTHTHTHTHTAEQTQSCFWLNLIFKKLISVSWLMCWCLTGKKLLLMFSSFGILHIMFNIWTCSVSFSHNLIFFLLRWFERQSNLQSKCWLWTFLQTRDMSYVNCWHFKFL